MSDLENDDDEVTHLPIDGVLDLHTFNPKDISDLVDEYITACAEKGLGEIRLIHGKGRGVLRRKVHAILKGHRLVLEFGLDSGPSGWGATLVQLKKAD